MTAHQVADLQPRQSLLPSNSILNLSVTFRSDDRKAPKAVAPEEQEDGEVGTAQPAARPPALAPPGKPVSQSMQQTSMLATTLYMLSARSVTSNRSSNRNLSVILHAMHASVHLTSRDQGCTVNKLYLLRSLSHVILSAHITCCCFCISAWHDWWVRDAEPNSEANGVASVAPAPHASPDDQHNKVCKSHPSSCPAPVS